METLVKLIGKFFGRDFLYILGGTSIILSFLYLFDIIPNKQFKNYELFFIISVGYVVGYLNQEFYSLTTLIKSHKPNKISGRCKWVFKRFTHRNFNEEILIGIPPIDFHDISKTNERYDEIQRVIFHKHVGITMGSSAMTCALILLFKLSYPFDRFNLTLVITCLFMSLILIAIGWIKLLLQAEYIYEVLNGLSKYKGILIYES
jgi:hypothetical protein